MAQPICDALPGSSVKQLLDRASLQLAMQSALQKFSASTHDTYHCDPQLEIQ